MINAVIGSISRALKKEFGSRYKTYKEEKHQGLEEPCFFISCINPTKGLFLMKRYFRQNQFCIQYFPETEKKNEECHTVAERLFVCLENLTVDGISVCGTNMNYEVTDGILHFFVNYDMYVYRVTEPPAVIGEVSCKTSVKGQVMK